MLPLPLFTTGCCICIIHRKFRFDIFIVSGLPICNYNRKNKTENHPPNWNGHCQRDLRKWNVQSIPFHFLEDDVLEQKSKSKRNEHIRRLQTKCQSSCNRPPIHFHFIEDSQKRWNENWNKSNMNRNQVLR